MKYTHYGEAFSEKFSRLMAELEAQLANGERLTAVVRQQLASVESEDSARE